MSDHHPADESFQSADLLVKQTFVLSMVLIAAWIGAVIVFVL